MELSIEVDSILSMVILNCAECTQGQGSSLPCSPLLFRKMPVYQMALYEDVRIDVPHRRVQLFLIDVRIFDKEEKLKKNRKQGNSWALRGLAHPSVRIEQGYSLNSAFPNNVIAFLFLSLLDFRKI